MSELVGAALIAFDVLGMLAAVAYPPLRRKLIQFVFEARRIYIELPLRAITGRRRPNYARIAELERAELPRT